MIDKLKPLAARLRPALSRLPAGALSARLAPVLVVALALTGAAMMYLHHADAQYKPLYGAAEQLVAADAMAALDAEGIPYRLHPGSGQVLVPEARLGHARMLLAAKGVSGRLPAGLETVDRSDPLGVSQFVQDVRFRRGLEGELARSIMSLEAVAQARVHLSVVRSSSFIVGDGGQSSASVMLGLKPGRRLEREQVAAIVALVAGSVANLGAERVSVVDQSGHLLSALVDPEASLAGASGEAATRVRMQTLRNIHALLEPVLGADNFRASVAVELNQDRVDETREQFGEAPRVTQEATREESDRNTLAQGVPGTLSNRPLPPPGAIPAGDAAGGGPASQRNATTRQYAYDRNIVQIKHDPQRIKRLSVAVVLNNSAGPGADAQTARWQPAQIAEVESLLRSGIGIDAGREDVLVVSALAFKPDTPLTPPPWYRDPANLASALPYLGYTALSVLAFLLVIRPLMRIAQRWADAHVPDAALARLEGREPGALAMPGVGARPALLQAEPKLPPVGSEVDVLVDHLRVLATQAPERVAEVIKPWIRPHG